MHLKNEEKIWNRRIYFRHGFGEFLFHTLLFRKEKEEEEAQTAEPHLGKTAAAQFIVSGKPQFWLGHRNINYPLR